MTTGWGNLISRRGGHFSVPFEIGAVFIGSPTLALNPNGIVCHRRRAADNGHSCVNMPPIQQRNTSRRSPNTRTTSTC